MKMDQEFYIDKSYSTCEEMSHKNLEIYSEKNKIKSLLLERKDQEEEKIQGSKNIINRTYLSY